jgi:hypothetical protein
MAAVVAPIPPPFFTPYLDDQVVKLSAKQIPWEVCRVWKGNCVYWALTGVRDTSGPTS